MKLKQMLIITLIVFLLSVGIVSYLYSSYQVLNVKEFQIVGKVGPEVGIGFNGTQILMGTINPGGKSIKHLNVTNDYPFNVTVYFKTFGNIADYMIIDPAVAVVSPGGNKNIDIFFTAPEDLAFGKYTGTLRGIFRRK